MHWPDWPPGWEATTLAAEATKARLELPATLLPRALAQLSFALTTSEVAAKRRALATYVTQQEAMPSLLAAFVRRTEPFTAFSAAELDRVEPIPGSVDTTATTQEPHRDERHGKERHRSRVHGHTRPGLRHGRQRRISEERAVPRSHIFLLQPALQGASRDVRPA